MTPQALLAAMGEGRDDSMIHAETGEMIVPRDIVPDLIGAFVKSMEKQGMDFRDYIVRPTDQVAPDRLNKNTGLQHFRAGSDAGGAGAGSGAPSGGGAAPGGQAAGRAMAAANRAGQAPGGQQAGRKRAAGLRSESIGPDTSQLGPILGPMMNALPGFTMANMVAEALGGLAPEGTGRPSPSDADPSGVGGGGGQDRLRRATSLANIITGPRTFTRPMALSSPGPLGFGGETDLQRRAAIATGALNADDPLYKSEESYDYFRNLLQRSLIDDQGGLADFSTVLPIEQQFLTQGRGLQFGQNTQSLLEAIA